jgi:hypothetical protein
MNDHDHDSRAQLKGQEAFHRFATAGRAIFTIRSERQMALRITSL